MLLRSNRQTTPWLWTALGLGLALRLWFLVHDPRIAGDTFVYGGIAKNWMLHDVYGWGERGGVPQPTLIRLPGYPLFLMVCFRLFGIEHYNAVLYTQVALDLLACLLLGGLAGRLFGERAQTVTLWLAVLCPFTASYTAAALTETLTLACVVFAFYTLHRWQAAGAAFNRWLWPIAASLASSILLRPEQGLLAAAVLPAMLWVALSHRRSLSALVPVIAVALLTLAPLVPWAVRNYRSLHVFQPLAPRQAVDPGEFVPLGFQRWYRTWAIDFASTEDVYWNWDGATIPLADLPARAFDTPQQQARTSALLDDYNRTTTPTPELDARFNDLAAERIASYPLRYYVALPVARLVNMAFRPRVEMFATPLEWWRFAEHPGQTIFAAGYAMLNLAYFAFAVWGAVLWHRTRSHRPLLYAMLASVALRAALLLTLDNSEPRYTLEFFPVFFVLAALPLSQIAGLSSRRKDEALRAVDGVAVDGRGELAGGSVPGKDSDAV